MRVVVVLPLVPVIAADPSGNRARELRRVPGGLSAAPRRPGTVEPPPVFRASGSRACAARAATTAAERRALSRSAGPIGADYSRSATGPVQRIWGAAPDKPSRSTRVHRRAGCGKNHRMDVFENLSASSRPEGDALDAYSRAVREVTEQLEPAVVSVGLRDGRGGGSGVVLGRRRLDGDRRDQRPRRAGPEEGRRPKGASGAIEASVARGDARAGYRQRSWATTRRATWRWCASSRRRSPPAATLGEAGNLVVGSSWWPSATLSGSSAASRPGWSARSGVPSGARAGASSRTSSRRTPRSTRATPAGRSRTPPGRWSGSTPRSSAALRGSASPSRSPTRSGAWSSRW